MVGFMCLTFEARRPTFDPELTGCSKAKATTCFPECRIRPKRSDERGMGPARKALCVFLRKHGKPQSIAKSVHLSTDSQVLGPISTWLHSVRGARPEAATCCSRLISGALPGCPRQSELEQSISVDQWPSVHFASEQRPSSFPNEDTDRHRSCKCFRADRVMSSRTCGPLVDPTTLRRCRPSGSTLPPWFLCQCQSHSWRVSESRYELVRERYGIDQRWY